MKQEIKPVSAKEQRARKNIRQVRRNIRRKFSAEEKIRIILEALRGEVTISELCRREGISPSIYYKWSKSFLEAGKQMLMRDNKRNATSDEVQLLKRENSELKRMVAEQMLKLELYKKSLGC